MKPTLILCADLWNSLRPQQQQEQRERFAVAVQPSYAPAPDLDQLREMAPVAKGGK